MSHHTIMFKTIKIHHQNEKIRKREDHHHLIIIFADVMWWWKINKIKDREKENHHIVKRRWKNFIKKEYNIEKMIEEFSSILNSQPNLSIEIEMEISLTWWWDMSQFESSRQISFLPSFLFHSYVCVCACVSHTRFCSWNKMIIGNNRITRETLVFSPYGWRISKIQKW